MLADDSDQLFSSLSTQHYRLRSALVGAYLFFARLAVVKFVHCYYPPDIHLFKPDTASFQACKKYPCKVLVGTQEN